MSDAGTGAYRSISPVVVDAWERFKVGAEAIMEARRAMADRYGRNLWIERSGFGHGTRIVAFERLDTDPEGLPPELRLMANGRVQPNIQRQAGKRLRKQLETLSMAGPDLPGMPAFALSSSEQMIGVRSMSPALERYGQVYAFWGEPLSTLHDQVDFGLWETAPLSEYFTVREAAEAEKVAAEAAGAGD